MINSRHRKNLKGLALKSLSLAALVGIMSLGSAYAATINDVDMTQIPLDTPTLDYLNKNNIYMLPKLDSNGNVISGTENILYPKSGYTLTEVKNADPENLPANTITKYELTDVTKYYHPETGAEVAADALEAGIEYKQVTIPQANPKYYTVGLKQTEYGTKDGATDVKYFNWGKDANGYSVLTEGASILKANDITYYIKKSTSELATERITTNLNGADVNKTFISMNSSSYGGAIYNDGSIAGITGDFIGNYVQTSSDGYGGAIYNSGRIGGITGNFVGNYVVSTSKSYDVRANGGAIFNTGTIGSVAGDFINNNSEDFGGAIYNGGTIGNITGDFINNNSYNYGGAIYNRANAYSPTAQIGNITGNFIGNYVKGYNLSGGAIYNYAVGSSSIAKIGDITGDFIENRAIQARRDVSTGGAICNNTSEQALAQIGNITGDFIGNHADVGGAIYNGHGGSIHDIFGSFIGNHSEEGGAIYNMGSIGNINGDFIENYITGWSNPFGGAIYNTSTIKTLRAQIGNINGNFIGNYTISKSEVVNSCGGAIFNHLKDNIGNRSVEIGHITGDFIGNYAKALSSSAEGGAIFNKGANVTIAGITGDFIGNYVHGVGSRAGAILNEQSSTINDITGNFIGNYAKATYLSAEGGAIYNYGILKNITGNFINNYAYGMRTSDKYNSAYGGAIFNQNYGKININADFIGNHVIAYGSTSGGAIYNSSTINNITGNFIGNYANSSLSTASGGAINIYYGTIGDITSNFIGNYVSGSSTSTGGAIAIKQGSIGDITGNFIRNYALSTSSAASGGAIYNLNYPKEKINSITADFIGNYAKAPSSSAEGGAVYNSTNINNITGNFVSNYVSGSLSSNGGAIYNEGTIGSKDIINLIGGIENSSFINNYAESATGTAQGGAIWTNQDLNIIAKDGYTSVISGNYVQDINGKRPEAIRVANVLYSQVLGYFPVNGKSSDQQIWQFSTKSLNLTNNTNAKTVIDDQIIGEQAEIIDGIYHNNYDYYTTLGIIKQYVEYNEEDKTFYDIQTPEVAMSNSKLNISGDGTGLVQLNNDVKNFDISLSNSTLHLGARDNVLDGNNLTMHSGTLNMINNQAGVSALNNLKVAGDTVMHVDVDLENKVMDRFTADSYGDHGGNVTVSGMNLLSDANQNENLTAVYFAQPGLKNNVINGVGGGTGDLPDSNYQTEVYTPIYKYNVAYDNVNQYDGKGDGGYFLFAKGDRIIQQTPSGGFVDGGSTGNMSDAFNPAVLGSSAMAAVGATATMGNVMRYSYQNAENFMNMPYFDRMAYKDKNKYALSPTGDATDFGTFSPLFQNNRDSGSGWFKPYASFENVALKNGPKVSNITYGSLLGFDTDIKSLKGGWDRTFTGYIGYHGASQRYSGVDSYQNGGLIGGTMTMFKGNFFNATTLSVGASVASNSTMYGNDNYTMLLGGIGNKTGYNIELREGKLIFQPSMIVSYTWVNTFDYTNAAGVKIENDPLHAIQLAPGAKLIANTKNGWQPYIGVNMVWNLMGKTDATANGVRLPAMSIKPFVQYGVGVQRRFCDHMMGFGQVMLHSGGRNGVSLNFGFRWALGSDCDCHNNNGKKLWKFARKNKEVEAQPYDMMYRGNQQFGLYSRKVIKQMASVERTKAMK